MKIEKSFLGEFTFDNPPVKCDIENGIDRISGLPFQRLAISKDNNPPLRMGYTPGKGLELINTKQRKNNPLGEFLGIKKDDLIGIKSFFEKYGFLVELANTVEEFSAHDFWILQNRMQAFIQLINNQNEFTQDIEELINAVLFLMFMRSTIENQNISKFVIYDDSIENLIQTPVQLNHKHNAVRYKLLSNGQKIGYVSRYSLGLGQDVEFSLDEIQEIEHDSQTPLWCKQILNLFFCLDNLDLSETNKNIIEFLFALIYIVDPFPIEYISLEHTLLEMHKLILSPNNSFKELLLGISKVIIVREFENFLRFVKPTYNTETMQPDWKLPSLLSALYFSIYYKNSKHNIYRKCANSNCNQYFEVSSTNSTKRHCSTGCSENKNARIARARKKQGS